MRKVVLCVWFIFSLSIFAEQEINFTYQIRPILSKYCFACHGPDKAEGKLRLNTAEGIKKSLKVNKSGEIEFVYRLLTDDKDDAMPPPDTGKKLLPKEKELLQLWIKQGAEFGEHWSFQPLKKQTLPAEVAKGSEIDFFINKKINELGLTSNGKASRREILRRLSLDIRGFLPTPEEYDEFSNDQSDNFYEKWVDKFLADPAYGEKWASKWLDLARYADTKGYEKDKHRDIWRYRDWVIEALNNDMAFTEFTLKQFAGDLLPDSTESDLLATAFHRNTMTNEEGGTDDEEFRTEAVKDRIDTTGIVWLGLSFQCAKCHTHKYDPVSIEEYYKIYSFMNQTADADQEEPMAAMPTAAQKARYKEVEKELDKLKSEQDKILKRPDIQAEKAAWEEAQKANKDKKKKNPPTFLDEQKELKPLTLKIKNLEKELAENKGAMTPIMRELSSDKFRPNYIHERGFFLNKGAAVTPGTPAFLHSWKSEYPLNRIGLAKWLTDEKNPLVGRVFANRVWAQIFGKGIVETEEDFGNQGAMPTHPELLDWLALEFMKNGWSQKKLIKTMVMTEVYQRSSESKPEQVKKDPTNQFFARGPRFRMTAEMVRDSTLQVAGLLSKKMYGPSVMPYQPEGLWKSSYNREKWQTSKGEDRYRRALYTYLKRTSPYPSMTTFDSTSREICTARRIYSNTPLQALVTLNDPVYVEAAQALARLVISSKKDFGVNVDFIYKRLVGRTASNSEKDVLEKLYNERLSYYQQHPEEAKKMAELPLGTLPAEMDLSAAASWTTVANVLLNLDEFLNKE